MDIKKEYERWLENATADANVAAELKTLDNAKIEDAFYRDLAFGTGGLRGVIGAGTNRMNIYTVAKASQGLADYLKKNLGIRVLLYWMSPNGKQALLQYRFRNVKNLKIYLRQIYRDSLKTYNNRAMRLLREECRHEFWASYEPASDNSGGKPENECWERCYPCSWKSGLYLRFAEERSEGYCNHAVCCGASHVL